MISDLTGLWSRDSWNLINVKEQDTEDSKSQDNPRKVGFIFVSGCLCLVGNPPLEECVVFHDITLWLWLPLGFQC